ncbi:hypothetical protein FOXB_00342, partial [Fusarium oxysporum f. sp. conglutinans Fo5176]
LHSYNYEARVRGD